MQRLEMIADLNADQVIAPRGRLEEPAIAVVDDHGSDIPAIEEIVDPREFLQRPAAAPLRETRAPVRRRIAPGRIRVHVVNEYLAGSTRFKRGLESERFCLPG